MKKIDVCEVGLNYLFNLGFEIRQKIAYRQTDDSIIYIHLRKNTHADFFYFDFGVYYFFVKSTKKRKYPKMMDCHIDGNGAFILDLLNGGIDSSKIELNELESYLDRLVSFVMTISTLEFLKEKEKFYALLQEKKISIFKKERYDELVGFIEAGNAPNGVV